MATSKKDRPLANVSACSKMVKCNDLYFVSPRERPWRQRVFRRKTLVNASATCVFSDAFKKGTPGLTRKGCVLQRVSLGALSDVTVVLGMRQSIDLCSWKRTNFIPGLSMGFIILINSPLSKNTGLCFFPETLEWQSDPGVCINLHPYCVHNLMFEVENKDIVYTCLILKTTVKSLSVSTDKRSKIHPLHVNPGIPFWRCEKTRR